MRALCLLAVLLALQGCAATCRPWVTFAPADGIELETLGVSCTY